MNFANIKKIVLPEGETIKIKDSNNQTIWTRLPNEYQEVEYIETQGAQYIETGYFANNTTRIYIEYRTPSSIPTTTSTVLFYSGSGASNFGYALGSSGASGKSRAFYGGTYTGDFLDTETNYIIDMNKNKVYINNELKYTFTSKEFVTAYPMPILAQYYNNQTARSFAPNGTRLYKIKIYDNNSLIRDLIPCYRKSDDEIGMYDLINRIFYINNGAGTFIKGGDV